MAVMTRLSRDKSVNDVRNKEHGIVAPQNEDNDDRDDKGRPW